MIKRTPFLTILVAILALAIGSVSAQSVKESDQVGARQQEKDAASTTEQGSGQYVPAIGASRTATYKARYRELINLSLIDTDIRDALSALAMDQEINIATATEVSGKISVHLYQVTLEKALHAITLAGGFSYHKHGGVYYVYKPKKAKDPQIDRLEMRIFQLQYADVDKIQEVLGGLPGIRMLKFHEPSKTIIIEDTPENIKKVERIIAHWDAMPKQVMIEARILEINLTDDMELGVEWATLLGDARFGTSSFSRSVLPTDGDVDPVPESGGSGLFFNLLTGSDTRRFAAAIDALQEKTNVNTLSTPKVLAIHGEPAKVQVGGQQGYSIAQTNLGVTSENIEFIDTGIVLEITPFIDDDGNVLLNVKPSITAAELEEGIPVTRTAFVDTWMVARSGDTVLIGGLIQDTTVKTRSEVPCLGDLPLLGPLFGSRKRSVDKAELVVLITPTVVDREKKSAAELEAIMRFNQAAEKMKQEPLPPYKQIWEFTKPWDKTIDKPASPWNETNDKPESPGSASAP